MHEEVQVSEQVKAALALVKSDQDEGTFFTHPFEFELYASNKDWLSAAEKQLTSGHYVPAQARAIDVPKPGFHIRPASHLSIQDQLALQYILLECKNQLAPFLAWSAGNIRFSYILSNKTNKWFTSTLAGWKNFRTASLAKIESGAQNVLITDISGFYENIDIQRLITELKYAGVKTETANLLSACLNKWAGPRHRGIPQGFTPAHLLSEFYLDSMDRSLKSAGFDHLRYADDIRIFSKTKDEARRGLHKLTVLLRDRGLNLQTAKSKILSGEEAKQEIDGVQPVINGVSSKMAEELELLEAIGYVGLEESKKALENHESPPPEVLKIAWTEFSNGEHGGFNKTLFHYLLNRLAVAGMDDAILYVLDCLRERPEETKYCLDYLNHFSQAYPGSIGQVVDILVDGGTLYEYQRYLILKWLFESKIKNEKVLDFCRSVGAWSGDRIVVRPYVIAYVGLFAMHHDQELLELLYRDSTDWLDRATIVCAIRHTAPELRNSFYGRVFGENPLVDAAVKYSKTKT